MALGKPLTEYESVKKWLAGLQRQWGENPADAEERLQTLEKFCEFVGRDPDAIIQECVREVESGKRISVKGRRFYHERIAEFQSSAPGDPRTQVQWGNTVRSFLIYNGIFMQSGAQF
ncbi:MAG: hypothetical protein HYS09_05200 [Chloroflexi bacterium]|nr:hypothetical protein [Chloroflexota bacterium]